MSEMPWRLVLDVEAQGPMFTPQPIGFVDSPYKDTAAIPIHYSMEVFDEH
jgi:hypothetical protein